MSIRRYIIFVVLAYYTCIIHGQNEFRGKLYDSESLNPIDAASVCLLNADSMLIAYELSSDIGEFKFDKIPNDTRYFSVNSLGYSPVIRPIPSSFKNNIQIGLVAKNFKLKEVTVRSKRLEINEDTLIYQTSGFKMPQDKSIEDVLRKMPGIEVEASGTITYEGKAINTFYIKGLDLLQGKYTLASKNLDAKKVKEVHVIENHQPVMTLKGKTFSDRAALNLVLTEDAKNTMLSIVTLGGGVDQTPEALYDNRLMTMLFSAEQQISQYIRVIILARI